MSSRNLKTNLSKQTSPAAKFQRSELASESSDIHKAVLRQQSSEMPESAQGFIDHHQSEVNVAQAAHHSAAQTQLLQPQSTLNNKALDQR